MKMQSIALGIVAILIIAGGLVAVDAGKGNGLPSGPHYTLNIIAKKNFGNGDYSNFERNTIFVKVDDKTKITYEVCYDEGAEFGVLDGNGGDGECAIQFPYDDTRTYSVWLVSLGKPPKTIEDEQSILEYVDYYWTYDEETGVWVYELGTFTYNRHSKKPQWNDITELFLIEFYNITADPDLNDPVYEYYLWQIPQWLWDQIEGYWWNTYGNDHLIQVRIYPE